MLLCKRFTVMVSKAFIFALEGYSIAVDEDLYGDLIVFLGLRLLDLYSLAGVITY